MADDYTTAERARINLARHFSPNVVDELASDDEPFGPVRRQDVAVLFADIVGFTAYSEDHPAGGGVRDAARIPPPHGAGGVRPRRHRRQLYRRLHHGDFRRARPAADDAARALRCARAMAAAVDEWNGERRARGRAPVDVRIGCQYGPVVLGAIGSERNLSFAVVGDTCNVASRLQAHVPRTRRRNLRRRRPHRGGEARRRRRRARRHGRARPHPCPRPRPRGRGLDRAEAGIGGCGAPAK